MENETTESNTATEEAAPVAAAVPTVEAGTEQSAPETTQPEAKAEPQRESAKAQPKHPREYFKERGEKREQKYISEIETLKKQLAEKEAAPKTEPIPSKMPSLLDDPEGYANWLREDARREARGEFEKREQAYLAEQKKAFYADSATKSGDWLLTRSDVKQDPKLVDEVMGIVAKKYAHLAALDGAGDPGAAMRLAYIDVCATKGIVPDMDGFKGGSLTGTLDATKGAASTQVRPSPASGNKREFRRGEVEKYIMQSKPGTPEFSAKLREIEEAERDGRIK